MFQKKRRKEKKNERRPHVGNCEAGRQERPSTSEDSTPPRHLASSRHLGYIRMFRHSHQPPGYQLAAPHSTTASYWKHASRSHVY